jgi:hypothetical protein
MGKQIMGVITELQNGENHALERFFRLVCKLESEYHDQDNGIKSAWTTESIIDQLHQEMITLNTLKESISFACELRGRLREKDKA